jgi:hypothetical protein
MIKNRERLTGLGVSFLAVLVFSSTLLGQSGPNSKAAPVVNDWTQRHIIFSRPASAERAKKVEQDIRYQQQQQRMSAAKLPPVGAAVASEVRRVRESSRGKKPLKRDWAEDMNSGASVGAGNYPAKFSFSLTTANCASAAQPDFVVYGTGLAGSATQASIVAYDNIYNGCTGTVPTVYWAFNTGGTVSSSPVFSLDGTQVAFVQTDPSGNGTLVILRWAASTTETVSNPMTLTRLGNSSYPGCTAPCMTTEPLKDSSGNPNADTGSSVFYAYGLDLAFVGDDAGWLHKITPVFNGVPAEVGSAGWPVQVNSLQPTPLTNPVYDGTSGLVFVTDRGGYLYRVGPGTAFVAQSGQLDFSLASDSGPGLVQGPIIDSSAELVYVFASSDGSVGCVGGSDCTAVYALQADFPAGNTGQESKVGASTKAGTTPNPIYIGGFDSTYLNSANATGNLYVCGNTGGPPILYQVPIVASALSGSGTGGPIISISSAPCSPVTDVSNANVAGGAAEWIFASTSTGGSAIDCASGGCIYNFKNTPWQPSTAYLVGQEVLDNNFQIEVVSVPGTSGSSTPIWHTTAGQVTNDGSVQWLDQGVESATTLPAWQANHSYTVRTKILDNNNNVEYVSSTGRSGGTIPTFSTAPGGTTSDGAGGLVWTNLGAIGTQALPVAGGASGIVIDNTVHSATLGTSQVYFSTLSNQPCGTSGAGGCAIQASQSGLQ